MPNNFYECIIHESRGSEDYSKIATFLVKTTSLEHRSGDIDDPDLLKKVVTDDESWVYGYDIETKPQSSQWKRSEKPRPKKVHQVRSNVKVLFTVFCDCNCVVHHEFLPQGRTSNKAISYAPISSIIHQKCTELRKNESWILHRDNTHPHTSMLVPQYLVKNKTVIMPQPLYSPDLANAMFFLFPKLKTLKRKRFVTIEKKIGAVDDTKTPVSEMLRGLEKMLA